MTILFWSLTTLMTGIIALCLEYNIRKTGDELMRVLYLLSILPALIIFMAVSEGFQPRVIPGSPELLYEGNNTIRYLETDWNPFQGLHNDVK